MGVFKKQGVYWIDYDVGGHRKRERIGLISGWPKRYCASSIMTITYARHPAHNSPFLTSQVDTNLTPIQMKLDHIPRYKSTVEIPVISQNL